MLLRIIASFMAAMLAGLAMQAAAQDGHYWNGLPYGAGQYPWEQGGSGNDRNWNSGDWNGRHHYHHNDPNNGAIVCNPGSGQGGSPAGIVICGSPGNVR